MNRKKKRDPRRRPRYGSPSLVEEEARILLYLATEFERAYGRWPDVGDILMIDEDGTPLRRGTGPFPSRP